MTKRTKTGYAQVAEIVRHQAVEGQFWRLFDLQYGTRNALLTAAVGIAIPLYIVGSATPLSEDWVWATAGFLVILWGAVGLIPVYAIRKHFVEETDQVQRFMENWTTNRPSTEFVPAVNKFLRHGVGHRSESERRALHSLFALEQTYAFMLRHALWFMPGVIILTATAIVLVQRFAS